MSAVKCSAPSPFKYCSCSEVFELFLFAIPGFHEVPAHFLSQHLSTTGARFSNFLGMRRLGQQTTGFSSLPRFNSMLQSTFEALNGSTSYPIEIKLTSVLPVVSQCLVPCSSRCYRTGMTVRDIYTPKFELSLTDCKNQLLDFQ